MASPNISFFSIPANIRKPGVYIEENTSNALRGLTPLNDSVVLLAQLLSTGTVAANTPTKVYSDADAALYFGTGSIAHLAARKMFQANANVNLTICAMADVGVAKATGSMAFAGTATAAGQMDIFVGDEIISAGVAVGDTATVVATTLETALASKANYLPALGVRSTAALNWTARNAGTLGNQITLSVNPNTVTGITCTVTQMSGGAVDPDVGAYGTPGTTLAAIVAGGYTIVCSTLPDSTNLGKIKTMIDFMSGAMEQRPGICAFGATEEVASYATIQTLCGTTLNHGRTSCAWITYGTAPTAIGTGFARSEPWKVGAAYAAMLAYNSDPAVPYDGLPLVGIAAPAVVDRMTRTQCETGLNAGVTPLEVVPGDQVTIVRAVSTYTTTASVPDPTLLDITTIRTLDYVRAQVRTRLALRFVRAKLSTKTPARVVSQVLDVLYQLEQLEIVQNVALYKSGVISEIDTQNLGQVNVKIPTNVVQGLHVIAGVVDLIL